MTIFQWIQKLILLSLIILQFIFLSCSSRKDESLDKAVFNYIFLCRGGSLEACRRECGERYGENVTTENLSQINACFSSCQNNCNLQNILLLLDASR